MCNAPRDFLTPIMNHFRMTRQPPTPTLILTLNAVLLPAQTACLTSLRGFKMQRGVCDLSTTQLPLSQLRWDGTRRTQMECDRANMLFTAPIDPLYAGACCLGAAGPLRLRFAVNRKGSEEPLGRRSGRETM